VPLTAAEFGDAWLRFLEQAVSDLPPVETPFRARVRAHLGADPAGLPIVAEALPVWEHPNLQRALDAWLAGPGRQGELLGLAGHSKRHMGLSDLLAEQPRSQFESMPRLGSVDYENLDAGRHGTVTCVAFGLYLLTDAGQPLALLVRGADERSGQSEVNVEVLGPTPERGRELLAELRALRAEHNVYRGQVLTLASPEGPFRRHGVALVGFPELARPRREEIVLPEGVLERIERQTIGFAEHAAQLAAQGRHLKRGLLLHGPPGTGKTLSVMYLLGRMTGRTVVVLTGRSLGFVGPAFALAQSLQPCTIVLEDVDLVAEERTYGGPSNSVLFELLNAMDGLGEDSDTLVLLTTNRPDLLEPALAARPGRIDLAVEIPLPDAEGRRRLLQRYGEGVGLDPEGLDGVVTRTDGVSAAFIRELVRRAALLALEGPSMSRDPSLAETRQGVGRDHLDAALDELLVDGGALTVALLGGAKARRAG
jgi:hypothetical protein